MLKGPLARYVDDFFGISKPGVTLTARECLTRLARICGFPCDDEKSADSKETMEVLGVEVQAKADSKSVEYVVDEGKAKYWAEGLEQIFGVK